MKRITDAFLLMPVVVVGLWLAFDVVVVFVLGGPAKPPTITQRLVELSHAYPIIPLGTGLTFGFLAGHFWGQF